MGDLGRVLVPAEGDVLIHPFHGALELVVVVDALVPAADDLGHVHGLVAHAQVFFKKLGVGRGTGDAHGDGAQRHVGLAAHLRHRQAGLGKPQQLFLDVVGNGVIADVLYVMAVDAERRQTLLRVRGQHRRQIHRARALRAVEAPDSLGSEGVHVHGLGAVAPAGGHADGHAHVLPRELLRAVRRLFEAADGGIGDDALYGQSAAVAQIRLEEVLGGPGQAHGLIFQALANALAPSVDDGADADLRQRTAQAVDRFRHGDGLRVCLHDVYLLENSVKVTFII